jgi:hypothetical protein
MRNVSQERGDMTKLPLKLIDMKGNEVGDRRELDRKQLTKPIKVKFGIEYEGEVVDISKEGIGIKFHPINSDALNIGNKLRVHIDMNGRVASIQGEIRRISEKFGHLILGIEYNRDEIALFEEKEVGLISRDGDDPHSQD